MSEKNNGFVSVPGKLHAILRGLKFILISYIVSVALIAVLSALIVYTDLPESTSTPVVKVITFFSVVLSAFLTARSSHSRGWLCGALVGGSNVCILILLGTAIYAHNLLTVSNLLSVAIGALLGVAGGVFGINSRK